jgi:MPBQ/MSBQ methyltransferase
VRPRELVGWILRRPSKRRVKIATSLRFLHEVLGLERLHYGLWDGEDLDLDGLRAAQERYSERLRSWIPEGVSSILDVGAGVGTDALELSRAGYEVEGLSPDP